MDQDPFAAIAQPVKPAAAPPPAVDPFASIATSSAPPATTTPPPKNGIPSEEASDAYLRNMSWWNPFKTLGEAGAGIEDVLEGAGKGVAKTVSGAGRLARRVSGGKESAAMQAVDRAASGEGESREAAAAFNRGVGETGENVGEFFSGEELLGLLGKAGTLMGAGEKLKAATQLANTIKSIPYIGKLLQIGVNAVKAGAIGGGQEFVKTGGDTDAALTTGAETAAVSGALESVLTGAGTLLRKVAPKTIEIAGERIPALHTQVDAQGRLTGEGANEAEKIRAGQQAGGQRVIENVSQGAADKALEDINATRRSAAAARPGALQLPAPEGTNPFTFELKGATEPIEGRTEMTLQPANKFEPAASRVPEGGQPGVQNAEELGSGSATAPNRMQKRTQAFTSETGEGAADEARGGGLVQTTDPQEAEHWRYQLENLMDSKGFEDMPEAKQRAIKAAHDQLQHQLGLYYSSPYAQRFAPAAAGQVRTFGEAANAIRTAVQPVYETLDKVSGGDFSKWRLQARQANKVIRNASSADAVTAAEGRLEQANGAINDLITKHASSLSRADYQAAKVGWSRASLLDNLHARFEKMTNGVTLEESERAGLPRVMTGNARALEDWLGKGTNRANLEKMIGTEGVDNLKRMTVLLGKADTARPASVVLKNVAHELHRNIREGALLGGAAGEAVGGHWAAGAALGSGMGVAAWGAQQVLRYAATNPAVGKLLDYAVSHGVAPNIYAPLIARTISTQLQDEPTQQEEGSGDQHGQE